MRTPYQYPRIAVFLAALSACGMLYAQEAPQIAVGPGAKANVDTTLPSTLPATAIPQEQEQPLSADDLDTLLAPIALYPDSLLSQVLMASTYPLEVVQADRWVQANPNLTGDALADALNQQSWDPSVKSLVNTPTVLQMMDDKLDWTVRLGNAFLAQQADVMNSVQRLRAEAQQAGNLRSTPEQKITYENAYADGTTNPPVPQYIEIEQTSPEFIFVPVFDPFIVFGPRHHFRRRPFFFHPHGLVSRRFPCGPAWGFAWGQPDWRHHDLDLDFHRNSTLNPRFNRNEFIERHFRNDHDRDRNDHDRGDHHDNAPRPGGHHEGPIVWQHDPGHRRGVVYGDPHTAQRFGGGRNLPNPSLPNAASPRLPNTISPNLPNTVSPRLPNSVSPNLPNTISPRLPNAATPDQTDRGSAPVKPEDRSRDQRNDHPSRQETDRPNRGDRQDTNRRDAGGDRDHRSEAPKPAPTPVPPPPPAPEPKPIPPAPPKPTPPEPPAPQTPAPQTPAPQAPAPRQAPAHDATPPSAPPRRVEPPPRVEPRHETPRAPEPAPREVPRREAPAPEAPRGGPHGSAGAPDTPRPAETPSRAPSAGPHGGK